MRATVLPRKLAMTLTLGLGAMAALTLVAAGVLTRVDEALVAGAFTRALDTARSDRAVPAGYVQPVALPAHLGMSPVPAVVRPVALGDEYAFAGPGGLLRRYHVTEIRAVDAARAGLGSAAPGQRMLLVTCAPLDGVDGHVRFLVEEPIGERASNQTL